MVLVTKIYLFTLIIVNGLCLKVTLERAYIANFNPKYVDYAFVNVTRYGRHSDYHLNFEFVTKFPVNNNVTVCIMITGRLNMIFYELRRNEYTQTFVKVNAKVCDFLAHDQFVGAVIAKAGVSCPVQAKKYSLMNLTINMEDFPNVFPFEKGRINFCFNSTISGESLGEVILYLSFKNEAKGRKHG